MSLLRAGPTSLWRSSAAWRWIVALAALSLALGFIGAPWQRKETPAVGAARYAPPKTEPAPVAATPVDPIPAPRVTTSQQPPGVIGKPVPTPLAQPVIADSMMGREFRKSVDVGGQVIPLPEGTWLTLAAFKGTYESPGDTMLLGKLDGSRLKGLIAVYAYRGPTPSGKPRPNKSCLRQDVIFQSNAAGEHNTLECWWVNHATSVWQDQAIFRSGLLELTQRKIDPPSVFINVAFHRATAEGFATTFYMHDPGAEGIVSTSGKWFDSEWRKDRLAGDKARTAYTEKLIEWGRAWAPAYFVLK